MTETVAREDLHRALWTSYVGPRTGIAPERVLDTLARAAAEPARMPLVALALWNLLPDERAGSAPALLARLVRDVLGLGLDEARHRRRGPNPLPPFLELEVLDANCDAREERDGRTCGAVEICVLTHLDDLASVAEPTTWLGRCDVFWDRLYGGPSPGGVLQLPGGPALNVSIETKVREGGLRKEIDVKIRVDGQDLAHGKTVLAKERGRPGATRIWHERTVHFGAHLQLENRAAALAYWLQTEAIFLAIR